MATQKIKTVSNGKEDYKAPLYTTPVLAVLDAKEDGGEWAVYYGKEEDGHEFIREYGQKMPVEMARILFPNIHGPYRD